MPEDVIERVARMAENRAMNYLKIGDRNNADEEIVEDGDAMSISKQRPKHRDNI